MKQYLLILATTCLFSVVSAQQTLNKTIVHNGITREYILYIPDMYTGDNEVPLVLNFHGYGSNAQEQMVYGDFRAISDTAGFIIAHPQGTLLNGITHWNVGGWTIGSTADDIGFIDALIDSISEEYVIDASRIYSTGMSNGGFMSFLLACQLNNKITAIASVTGSMTPETYNYCIPEHPTAILQFHGTSDFVVPYTGALWTKSIEEAINYWVTFNNCNLTPIITNLPDIDPNDGSTVTHYNYSDGDNFVNVEHYKIIGGGHTWPGSDVGGTGTNNDINASIIIWEFFNRYQLDNGTAIYNERLNQEIIIFPNPAEDFLNIELKDGSSFNFELFSVIGSKVLSGKATNKITKVDLRSLPDGLYFLQIAGSSYRIVVN